MIMGRGIEGCGVTKFTLELHNWLNAGTGFSSTIFASADKSWTRKKSHSTDDIKLLKFKKDIEVDNLIKEVNAFDYVILNSLPPISMEEKVIQNFNRFLNNITPRVILIQHDHSSLSIKRNACISESIKRADKIFVHSTTNDFVDTINEVTGNSSLDAFFGDNDIKEVIGFQPGMSFQPIRNKYWKDLSAQDSNHHKWVGRTTSWKGYQEMFRFHNGYLKPNNYLTTFEGIEKSPAYLAFRELSEFHGMIDRDISQQDLSKGYGDHAYVFGPYNNSEMLERMSRVGYGYQLSLLKPKYIQRSIEYTHCEVVCTGVIPVFRKDYGERCMHRHYKKPLIECENTGTIWLNDDSMPECIELIKELNSKPKMREEWRNNAYEFYKLHQDAMYTFPELLNHIL